MSTSNPISYWNREKRQLETEKVYGEAFVRWTYETGPGIALTNAVLTRPFFSDLYGRLQSSRVSARKVPRFISEFQIPMEEYETPAQGFRSFNEFFIRKFRPGRRAFPSEAGVMGAPAEARYLAFDRIREDQVFPVKGHGLMAEGLLGSADRAKPFIGGPLLLARLCPVDYHRYHYPDGGSTVEDVRLPGKLHSVNPVALRANSDIFISNERRVSILATPNFGRLAYIEVGALCVGRIVQSHPTERPFARGDEKGYFLFGGSTVIVLGEPGAWKPDADVLAQTARDTETYVKLGDRIASVA